MKINVKATSNVISSGEWMGIHGQVLVDSKPLPTAEVWLLINGGYVKCIPQTSWHNRFWFHARFGAGRYRIQVEGYKIMLERDIAIQEGKVVRLKKEYKIKSPPITIFSSPRILSSNRMLPRIFEVENWRRITITEGVIMTQNLKKFILERYPDTSKIFLVGGVVDRGWTRRDIDIMILSEKLFLEEGVKARKFEKECEEIVAYPVSILTRETELKEKIRIYPGGKL